MTIRTTCPYCGVGCGIAVIDGVPQGDAQHPANFGRLCSKGAALKHTLALPERLTTPTLHRRPAEWNEALDYIAAEFLRIRETDGPDAIAFYVSGQFLTEDYYVANKLMKGFIGAANIDTNSRLCMSSSVAGHVRAFGEDVVPGCYEDLDESDLVVQVGSNMAWCHPVLYQRLMQARERRGTRIVTIDPRRTATAETSDLHLPLTPGTDVMLFNGLLVHLSDAGAIDPTWIGSHVSGFDETLAAARRMASSLDHIADTTGVTKNDLLWFYDTFARTERVVTLYSQGVNQSISGTDKVNAILNCHLATGRIGRAGMGPFSLTGQPNAMGGREVGGLANQLAAHMAFDPADLDRVRRFWNAPRIATKPGYKAVDLFDAVGDGHIKAIWIAATNPAASMPRADHVRAALEKCPLVVVSDAWPTDTTALADVVLPAATWAEKDGTVTNSERRISRQRAFRAAPGEARPDWWMFTQVAQRMGWQREFGYCRPADIFREHAALSGFENEGRRLFNIGALAELDDAAYDSLSPVQWPCLKSGATNQRLFGGGGFPTSDRRGRMVPLTAPPSAAKQTDHALTLNTGRVRDQWHTMTRTGRVPHLMTHVAAPRIAMHPRDAAARGLEDGTLARIHNTQAAAVLRVAIDPAMRIGDVFVPMHWTDQFSSSGPIGRLVHTLTDPVSGQPDLKGSKVEISPIAETWRGLLLRRSTIEPVLGNTVYWTKAPIAGGCSFELSGWSPLATFIDSEAVLRALLHLQSDGELITYSDPKRSVFRYAGLVDGRLESCVFFADQRADFAEADRAKRLLGHVLEPMTRFALLAGLETNTTPKGKVICSCFAVDETTIRDAVSRNGLSTTAEIGSCLGAGTNCGSCIPELKKILSESVNMPALA